MSRDSPAPSSAADQHPAHGSPHTGDDGDHGSLRGYLTGFVLAAILTAIPFWLVMDHVITSSAITILLILIIGIAQIFVHLVYFLQLNSKAEEGWKLMTLVFTFVLVVIVLAGSIWVMYHLANNMMMGPVH